jgi:hypothetical protein
MLFADIARSVDSVDLRGSLGCMYSFARADEISILRHSLHTRRAPYGASQLRKQDGRHVRLSVDLLSHSQKL